MQPEPTPPSPGFDPVRLIQAHQAGVWRYLRSLGCEHALAEDLVQETFLAVLERPFVEQHVQATAAYLRRIALNRYVSHLRRSGKVTLQDDFQELTLFWERYAPQDQGEAMLVALKECWQQLTPRAQLALGLRFRDDLSREAIAAQLEITEHGAKNLMQRAKQQLKECIEGKLK